MKDVTSETDARAKGFVSGDTYKLIQHDFVMVTLEEAQARRNKA